MNSRKGYFRWSLHQKINQLNIQSILVLVCLAHVDAGKTTLAESMLYLSGKLKKLGRVDHKDTFFDTNEIERERGITIFSKQAELIIADKKITLLDTPGHVDFSAETNVPLWLWIM